MKSISKVLHIFLLDFFTVVKSLGWILLSLGRIGKYVKVISQDVIMIILIHIYSVEASYIQVSLGDFFFLNPVLLSSMIVFKEEVFERGT